MEKAAEIASLETDDYAKRLFAISYKNLREEVVAAPIVEEDETDAEPASNFYRDIYTSGVAAHQKALDFDPELGIEDPLNIIRSIETNPEDPTKLSIEYSSKSESYSLTLSYPNYMKLVAESTPCSDDPSGPVKYLSAPLGGLKGGAPKGLDRAFSKSAAPKKVINAKRKELLEKISVDNFTTDRDLINAVESIQTLSQHLEESLNNTTSRTLNDIILKDNLLERDPIFSEFLDVYPGSANQAFPKTTLPVDVESEAIEDLVMAAAECKLRLENIKSYQEYIGEKLAEQPQNVQEATYKLAGKVFETEDEKNEAFKNTLESIALRAAIVPGSVFPASDYLKAHMFSEASGILGEAYAEQDKRLKYRTAQRVRAEKSLAAVESAISELKKKRDYLVEIMPVLRACEETEKGLSASYTDLLTKSQEEFHSAQLCIADSLTNSAVQAEYVKDLGNDLAVLNAREIAIKQKLLEISKRILETTTADLKKEP